MFINFNEWIFLKTIAGSIRDLWVKVNMNFPEQVLIDFIMAF